MKSNLSHILPVHQACEILEKYVVLRLVTSLLLVRQQQQAGPLHTPAPSGAHEEAIHQDAQVLTEALMYKPPKPAMPTTSSSTAEGGGVGVLPPEPQIPTLVQQSWKRWMTSRSLALDKATLIQFIVPQMVQPHAGPSGHMGLFDCWIYALQGHSNSSASSYYGGAAGAQVYFPDLLIVLAVAQQYRDYCCRMTETQSLDDHPALGTMSHDSNDAEMSDAMMGHGDGPPSPSADMLSSSPGEAFEVQVMAKLAFRLFDSYQKKGSVTRDTMHRFLTDVHGEDSYKKGPVKALLDEMFEPTTEGGTTLQATLSEPQFVRKVQETVNPARPSHILLDWMAALFCSFIPPDEVPQSVAAYLDTMEHRPRPLCDMYGIAESRLFEVKRRFHSLVRTATNQGLIQGDPISSAGDGEGDDEQPDSFIAASASSVAPPKHSIPKETFVEAVSAPNEELGNGGDLPERLARLVFEAGCRSDGMAADTEDSAINFWGLAHVLQFGCTAVRHNRMQPEHPDQPLLRLLFSVFQLAVPAGDMEDRRVLTRAQIEEMILLAIEHTEYRLERDQPPPNGLNDSNEKIKAKGELTRERTVDIESCSLLGLLPDKLSRSGSGKISSKIALSKIVDHAMMSSAEGTTMTFDEFCYWNNDVDGTGPATRLGPIMVDLRLIAAVLFGVPPTLASMEVGLIAEIERRHKSRYPQTSVSRRGPRGTVWYIIDAAWLKEWKQLTDEVSRTEEDSDDNRHTVKGPVRGLPRIDNADLLSPGGLLALRSDVRWKHDYEIVPPLSWQAMQAWYDGGPPIHRSVVRFVGGSANKQASPHSSKAQIPTENEIELHPFFVTIYLCDASSRGEARPFQQNYQLSRVSPMGVMLKQMCRELDVDADLARLWVLETGPNYSPREEDKVQDWLLRLDKNIVDQRKQRGVPANSNKAISLLLELKDPDSGLWPRGEDGKEWTFVVDDEGVDETPATDLGDGVVGLYNMGNTCYINTSLQCISHTPLVREYFTSKSYLKDVNTTNPLGHSGQLAQVSAVLINSLWKPFKKPKNSMNQKKVTMPGSYVMVNAQALTPKSFKEALGKFNELFAGNEQHDAQEFLTFLLGGLSEDLNRIMEKPYIEAPDSDGRPDSELADIWWENHLKREMSIVVALFTGQYKSLLTCRTCKYESARFEPFSTLTVPLPEDDHMTASLIVYPLKEGAPATKYCVRVKSSGVLRDVLIELAKVLLRDEGVSFKETEEIKKPENGDKEDDLSESDDDVDPIVVRRAQDLVIVDMRNGYIDKIAPISWKLHDIQNKETGDLPMLHVYELDPLQEKAPDEANDADDTEFSENRARYGFLALAQRRSEVVSRNFVHPLAHRVFGTPLLIRLDEIDTISGRKLYDLIAQRLRNLVPKTALRFLMKNDRNVKREESRRAVRKADFDTIDNVSRQSAMSSTKTDDEEVSAGLMPRYGFRLRVTTRDGRRCLLCPWYRCCIGCLVPDDFGPASVMDGDSIVVDWHFAVDVATSGFGMRANNFDSISSSPSPARVPKQVTPIAVKKHSSCGVGKHSRTSGSITLEECLEAFAKEEQIPEAYCSKCKDFRVQTTRMTLWRLPPVLVIHLKRFQFTATMRRKLRDLVVFPIEGLDVSKITAPDGRISKGLGKGATGEKSDDATEATDSSSVSAAGSESLYDLYGVIHHQGALSGGHYVASIKSETDGQWRLFNDAQIYEIHARDVVDASAYILFYIRRDVAKSRLPDVWDVPVQGNLSKEEVEQLVESRTDRCVIS